MKGSYFSFFTQTKKRIFIGLLASFSFFSCHDDGPTMVNESFIPLRLNLGQPALKVVDQVASKIEEVLIEQLDDVEYNKKHKTKINLQEAADLTKALEEMKKDNEEVIALSSTFQEQLAKLDKDIGKIISQKLFEKITFHEFVDFVRRLDLLIGPFPEDSMLEKLKPFRKKIKTTYAHIEEIRRLFVQPLLDKEEERKKAEAKNKELKEEIETLKRVEEEKERRRVKQKEEEDQRRASQEEKKIKEEKEKEAIRKKQIARLERALEEKEEALKSIIEQTKNELIKDVTSRERRARDAQDEAGKNQQALEDKVRDIQISINRNEKQITSIKSVSNVNSSKVSNLERYNQYAIGMINKSHQDSDYFRWIKPYFTWLAGK